MPKASNYQQPLVAAALVALIGAELTGPALAADARSSGPAAPSVSPNARVAIERAVRQIELGDYALARSWLEAPLIDARITPTERSRAYYLQGYSLEQQGFAVSAAQEYAKALNFNAKNPATLAALGHLYAHGRGVPQDRMRASELLRSSAALGHAPGMTRLGALLLAGLPGSAQPQHDLEEARRWLTNATELPYAASDSGDEGDAWLLLAGSYRSRHTTAPEPERALEYYQQALVLNQPAAFNAIGHMHLQGEFGVPDTAAAIAAFESGSQAGDAAAQTSLGYLLMTGRGTATDLPRAAALFGTAAANKDARAHHYLGYLTELDAQLTIGLGGESEQAAVTHYQRAASLGYLPALQRLSELSLSSGQTRTGLMQLRSLITALGNQLDTPGDTRENSKQLASASNQLAWILATHPDSSIRDGTAAVQHATTAVTYQRSAATLDTLAAAYAASNGYDQAVATQADAIQLLGTELVRAGATDQTDEPAGTPIDVQSQIDDYTRRLDAYRLALDLSNTNNSP